LHQVNEELSVEELKALLAAAKKEIAQLKKKLGMVAKVAGLDVNVLLAADDGGDAVSKGHSKQLSIESIASLESEENGSRPPALPVEESDASEAGKAITAASSSSTKAAEMQAVALQIQQKLQDEKLELQQEVSSLQARLHALEEDLEGEKLRCVMCVCV
jgi:hypothetical protein